MKVLCVQTCVCANRIYVHESVYGKFLEKYAAKVKELKMGDGLDPQVSQGPLINERAVEKVLLVLLELFY